MGLLFDLLKNAAGEGALSSALGRWRQKVSTAIDTGVSICGGLTQTVYVDAAADAGGDGSICSPYQTISAALAAIGSPVSAVDQARVFTLLIAGGLYNEALTIPSGRKIHLQPLDGVTLGAVAETGTQDITFTNNSADLFGGTGELRIDGPFFWQDTFINDDGVDASDTEVSFTNLTQSRNFDATGYAARDGGSLNVDLAGPRSQLDGVFDGPTASLQAIDFLFSGTVTTDTYRKLVGCRFFDDITVTTAPSSASFGAYGFHRSAFINEAFTFTGPPVSFLVDTVSYNSFEETGGTLAGTRVVRLDDCVLKSEAVDGVGTLVAAPSKVIYCVNIPGAGITVTLPGSPQIDDEYVIKNSDGSAGAGNVITVDGNGNTIDGAASQPINTAFGSLRVKFNGGEWSIL